MLKVRNWLLLLIGALAVIGLFIFCWFDKWIALADCFKPITVAELPGKLAPLAVAAAFIERAVEILISPWRDEGATKLEKAANLIKARSASPPSAQDATDLKLASDALDAYQGETQRYAFVISIALSALVSVAGFPSLGLFVDFAKCPALLQSQTKFLHCVDVLLSAALLAGGADGIHSIVNAITSFFQATAEKTTKAAQTPSGV